MPRTKSTKSTTKPAVKKAATKKVTAKKTPVKKSPVEKEKKSSIQKVEKVKTTKSSYHRGKEKEGIKFQTNCLGQRNCKEIGQKH